MNFPIWTFTVSSGTKASTAVKALVTNYNLMESAVRIAMGAMPSLEAYRKSLQQDNGNLSSGGISHTRLCNITASQHHTKLHGTTHITITDAIPMASTNSDGLMSSTQYQKVSNIASNAPKKPIAVGHYIGNALGAGSASKYINLGFTPSLVKIMKKSDSIGSWEAYNGTATVYHHAVTLPTEAGHYKMSAASTVQIIANGFKVVSYWCNQATATYFFVAFGG